MATIRRISMSVPVSFIVRCAIILTCEAGLSSSSEVNDNIFHFKSSMPGKITVINGSEMGKFITMMKCAIRCNVMSDICQGFVFQLNNCVENWNTATGNCIMVSFWENNNSSIPLSTPGCQRLYVADLCRNTNNPCGNGGVCSFASWPQICSCRSGYTGTWCEKIIPTSSLTGRQSNKLDSTNCSYNY
jgi:hypothetical protein